MFLLMILEKVKNCGQIYLSEPNKRRQEVCSKNLKSTSTTPKDPSLKENDFDLVFDTVGLEITRNSAIKHIKPGGTIVHIGLSQPSGVFDFRKATLQEITFIGTYCYTNRDFKKTLNILSNKDLGSLNWIEYRSLKDGVKAFQDIHNGSCSAPKIAVSYTHLTLPTKA